MRANLKSRVTHALDLVITRCTDAHHRDGVLITLLAAYVIVWTLYSIVAKSNQDLHFDMTELVAWSRDLALGFPKHPPFSAVIVRGWFSVLPITDGTFYLLGMVTSAISLWIAWLLFEDYLPPAKRILGVALLTFIPFFNFHALKFNVNTALMPLWAVTTLWFLRSYRTLSPTYAALAGVAAAFCMMTKYWSIFLFFGLGTASLSTPHYKAYFKSSAPWITTIVAIAAFSPHLGWLQKHGFSPIQYAMDAHGHHTIASAALANLRYIADTAAFASVSIALVLLAARPSRAQLLEMAWPADGERRTAAVAFWTTLLIPVVPTFLWGIELDGIWSMSAWTLLPVLLLSPKSLRISKRSTRRIIGAAVALPIVILLLSPAIVLIIHAKGMPPRATQIYQLSQQVESAWHQLSPKPLRFVGGDMDLADGVATYSSDQPQVLPGLPEHPRAVLGARGVALVCMVEDSDCVKRAARLAGAAPGGQVTQTELRRRFFGIDGPAQSYEIVVIPPEIPQKSSR